MSQVYTGRISAFAIASFLVFLVTSGIGIPPLFREVKFPIFDGQKWVPIEIPRFGLVFLVFHLALACRLYIHAWAIDELPPLRARTDDTEPSISSWRLGLEWFLRLVWVALVSYLPTVYAALLLGSTPPVTNSLELFYVGILLIVVFWDLLMFRIVIEFSNAAAIARGANEQAVLDRKRSLYKYWLGFDFILLLLLFCLYLLRDPWPGANSNWRPALYFLFLTSGIAICVVQLILWVPEIFRGGSAIWRTEKTRKAA